MNKLISIEETIRYYVMYHKCAGINSIEECVNWWLGFTAEQAQKYHYDRLVDIYSKRTLISNGTHEYVLPDITYRFFKNEYDIKSEIADVDYKIRLSSNPYAMPPSIKFPAFPYTTDLTEKFMELVTSKIGIDNELEKEEKAYQQSLQNYNIRGVELFYKLKEKLEKLEQIKATEKLQQESKKKCWLW